MQNQLLSYKYCLIQADSHHLMFYGMYKKWECYWGTHGRSYSIVTKAAQLANVSICLSVICREKQKRSSLCCYVEQGDQINHTLSLHVETFTQTPNSDSFLIQMVKGYFHHSVVQKHFLKGSAANKRYLP